jgi:hypothetical protein
LQLTIIAIFVFVLCVPVAGVGVAAYDLHVYDVEDLRRLGLRPFGHVPRFPGCRNGSLDQRMKSTAGASWKS